MRLVALLLALLFSVSAFPQRRVKLCDAVGRRHQLVRVKGDFQGAQLFHRRYAFSCALNIDWTTSGLRQHERLRGCGEVEVVGVVNEDRILIRRIRCSRRKLMTVKGTKG